VIKFENIHINYGGVKVIENLSLEIGRGEKVVIFGKSGSGKSSLFSLLLGFTTPEKGKVFFDGKPVDEKNVWNVRENIAYIDQSVSLGSGKIKESLASVFALKANAGLGFSEKRLNDLTNFFDLPPDVNDKNIEDLSGGEKQRLAIIIAILLKRNVFLLDEITSALDEALKKKVADYFANNNEYTCLINSHDPVWLENPTIKIFNLDEKKWLQ